MVTSSPSADNRYELGRRVGPWRVVPWTVYGGYQLHRYRWVDDGWSSDMEHDVWDRDATVYPTKEAAQAALDALEGIP